MTVPDAGTCAAIINPSSDAKMFNMSAIIVPASASLTLET
jgi:hypothetical protein